MNAAAPFDAMAADYDSTFGEGPIGRRFRSAVRRRLDAEFEAGMRVLEVNCGTGDDAIHLARRGISVVATDISPAMLEQTRSKIVREGVADRIHVAPLAIESLAGGRARLDGKFDGLLSNFGGLNCVDDLRSAARGFADLVSPGGKALLCIMGPLVPWEWGWFLARGEPRKAFRRLKRGGAQWRGMTINYPTVGAVRRAFWPHFRQTRVAALGVLLPPPYAEDWAASHPRLTAALDRWERRIEAFPPLPWLADHYLVEFVRRERP